jgi:hypothetical protein
VREWIDQAVQKVVVPNSQNKDIAFILFDPGNRVLKNVTFEKSFTELKAQALKAVNMIDRYDAVKAMTSYPVADKRGLLIEIFNKEKFHAIKSEIVNQLGNDPDEKNAAFIRAALRDPSVEVRKTVLSAVKYIPDSLRSDFEMLLSDSSYSIVNSALTTLAARFPQFTDRYLEITKDQYGLANEIMFNRLEIKAKRGDKDALQAITEYTGPSYRSAVRAQAFRILKRFNYLDDTAVDNMFEALLYPAGFLSRPAKAVADYFYEQPEFKIKIKAYYDAHNWEPWQKEILRKVVK